MKAVSLKRQRGAALLALLAVLVLGASWYAVSRLAAVRGDSTAADRKFNAAVLNQAKQALIGYVAHQAAVSGENNPGAFPCPEAPMSFNSSAGTDGRTQTPNCTLPAVGRFPWRTIGSEKFTDASGEPLWYVVASGWSKPGPLSTDTTTINSNCTDAASAMTCWTGQLNVDGQANAAVALIIAPGPAFNPTAATGCAAWNQVRPASGAPDWRNYLECENATNPADATFVTSGPSGSFNDQVVKITASEVLPLIEAAIADRFQHEIAPQIRSAYSSGSWPFTTLGAAKTANATTLTVASTAGMSANEYIGIVLADGTIGSTTISSVNSGTSLTLAANSLGAAPNGAAVLRPVLPFAAPFGNPTTSNFHGASTSTQGLLPVNYAFAASPGSASACSPTPCTPTPCTVGPDVRCDPAFVSWRSTPVITGTGGATLHSYSCSVSGTPTTLTCTLNGWTTYLGFLFGTTWMTFSIDATANNAGMALRQINSTVPMTGVDTANMNSPYGYSVVSGTLNSDGSATIHINSRVPAGSGSILGVLSGVTCTILGLPMCYQYTISMPMALLSDHPVVDPSNTTYTWFYRNKWHEVSYYAVAPGIAPSGARSCTTSSTCLQATYHLDNNRQPDDGKQRGLIVIAGRKLGTQVRPPAAVGDLLEGLNCRPVATPACPGTTSGTVFALRSTTLTVNQGFNDHFAVIDSNP